MEYIKYLLKGGDTLESLALEQGISKEQLVKFHNYKSLSGDHIKDSEIPNHLNYIFLELNPTIEEEILENDNSYIQIEQKARYRCEQFNTTKVEDTISFHCNTKKEYVLEKNTSANKAKVILKEYLYKINPGNLASAIEATKELEFDKENVVLKLDRNNRIEEVVNFDQIKKKWDEFKPKLRDSDFYKEVEKINANAAKDIITGGELEFESEQNLRKTYDKALFYHVLFNDFDAHKKRERNDVLKFISQIFVNIPIELELQHSIIKEDDYFIEYRTVGTLLKDKIDNTVLEEQYNKFYKPIIEYSFSEFNYEYRIRRMIDKKTNLIVNATAFMKEEVKNNYQFVTQFDLKQIEL